MARSEPVKDEDRKIRYLRRMVDFTLALIMQTDMTLEEASRHAAGVREFATKLFPGKGDVFDLVYAPRFRRVLTEKYRLG